MSDENPSESKDLGNKPEEGEETSILNPKTLENLAMFLSREQDESRHDEEEGNDQGHNDQ